MKKEYLIRRFDIEDKDFTTLEYAEKTEKKVIVDTDKIAEEIDKFVAKDTKAIKVSIIRQYADELRV